jgi:hypothetical protein
MTTIEIINGKAVKTQTNHYANGAITKLIFDNVQDIVPSDIILVKSGPNGRVHFLKRRQII